MSFTTEGSPGLANMERRLERLSKERKRRKRYSEIADKAVLAAFGLIFIVLATQSNAIRGTIYEWMSVGALVVAIAVTAVSVKIIRKLRLTGKQVTTVVSYDAYKAVLDLLDTDLRADQRKKSKKAVNDMVSELAKWKGKNAPHFITKPTDDLISGLRDKAIPILLEGTVQQVQAVKEMLHDLLIALDATPTAENISTITTQLLSLPGIDSNEEKEQEESNQRKLVASLVVGFMVGAIVGGVAAFFKAPDYASWLGGCAAFFAVSKFTYDIRKK